MTARQIMAELESLGSPNIEKILLQHGVREPCHLHHPCLRRSPLASLPFRVLLLCCLLATTQYCHTPAASTIRQIAIQPIYPYDSTRLPLLKSYLTRFFHRPVVLLSPIHLKASYHNLTKGDRYSADSIINDLATRTTDSITQVVGFTGEDIFTTKKDAAGHILQPAGTYAAWGIFGLGDCPGSASVISDYRLATPDENKFRHRLRTVLLHEIGHNLGLPHCPNPHCIMNDANETIATVDRSGNDFCHTCRRKLRL